MKSIRDETSKHVTSGRRTAILYENDGICSDRGRRPERYFLFQQRDRKSANVLSAMKWFQKTRTHDRVQVF